MSTARAPLAGERTRPLKGSPAAPFRLNVRAEHQQAQPGSTATDCAPGSGLSMRSGAPSTRSTGTRPREESAPPTKPSIAPPSASALREPERGAVLGSPLAMFQAQASSLSYRMLLVTGGAALGFGGLLASSGAHEASGWLSSAPWLLAAVTLVFSLSMAVLITLSFARRLD